jgi:ribosome-dependent ATPase
MEAIAAREEPVAALRDVTLRYGARLALNDVSCLIPAGCMVGLIGPDGVGKSSLLALISGARKIQVGAVQVLGGDIGSRRHRDAVCPRVAYMPQGLGKNLYPDLSVRENIEFFGRLFGQNRRERDRRVAGLLKSTGLDPFPERPAAKLSGGMRQKLGLCCALIHDPDLLILDEPTTGVDPLSRRQFWQLIGRMREDRPGMSVIVATAYMEEAEQFDWLIAMDGGRILATGSPAELKARTGSATLEDSFIALLPDERRQGRQPFTISPRRGGEVEPVIVARDLTRQFGDFTAVDHVNFEIERGEIFGFLGSNGCGKTTTMKMLTGLLPASSGQALLFGRVADASDVEGRRRVGYMSQAFSLYTELTVAQNLDLHARLFHIAHDKAQRRIDFLVERFGLGNHLGQRSGDLPLGIRQRLSLAVAVVHEPDLLILDEPTSGVDPLARDEFWRLLFDLSRDQGVTIFVSTHFMNEAARCDRIALMDAGRVLASGSPASLVATRHAPDLESAFVGYLEEAAAARQPSSVATAQADVPSASSVAMTRRPDSTWFSPRRLLAYAVREGLELLRDPIRLGFALFGSAFLMLVTGAGISTDVNNLTFAALDRDNSVESRAYLKELRGSPYFVEKPPLATEAEANQRLQSADIQAAIEIPPDFGKDLKKGLATEVGVWIDGAMPFRAETMRGYLLGVHQQFLTDLATREGQSAVAPANLQARFKYNQDFDSIYAIVPGTMALQLILFPAILMALAIVREKELGSITNLYVTPVNRVEFLIGKQLPYVAASMVNFLVLTLIAILVFQVPLEGSAFALVLGALIYAVTATGYGMLISSFCKTQIAALFAAAILTMLPASQFSGMLTPVSSLTGSGVVMGRAFPMSYFLPITVGTFTKGLGLTDLYTYHLSLLAFIPIFTVLSLLFLRKQER